MTTNPYQPPVAASDHVDLDGDRDELIELAKYQKGVLFCLLCNFVCYAGFVLGAPRVQRLFAPLLLAGIVAATVFVFKLARKVYKPLVGTLLATFTLLPFFGLFVLLIVNQRATRVLARNGIRVGFMGADASAIAAGRD